MKGAQRDSNKGQSGAGASQLRTNHRVKQDGTLRPTHKRATCTSTGTDTGETTLDALANKNGPEEAP